MLKRIKKTYATRRADPAWREMVGKLVDLQGKTAVDLGCGGGIYSRELVALGAKSVTGIDFSASNLEGRKRKLCGHRGHPIPARRCVSNWFAIILC